MTAAPEPRRLRPEEERFVTAQKWFHAIDLGHGAVTAGRFDPAVPPNYTLFGFFDLVRELDLAGARCVDVGTMDGLAAFVMKARGAREVIATDLAPRPTFELARDVLGLDVEYHAPVDALGLRDVLGSRRADVVLLAGVLYHVFDPVSVLSACREIVARDGWLIVETSYLFDRGRPIMSFNPVDPSPRALPHANVFWRPSKAAVEGMLGLVGFEVVATVAVEGRITVLARARRPAEIEGRTEMLRRIHAHFMDYANYRDRVDYRALQSDRSEPSRVRYSGPRGDRWLTRSLYEPDVPYQPKWRASVGMPWAKELARSARVRAATELARTLRL